MLDCGALVSGVCYPDETAAAGGSFFREIRSERANRAEENGATVLKTHLHRSRLVILALVAGLMVGVSPLVSASVAQAASLSAPSLSSPTVDEVVSGNPVLAWQAVSGAEKYRVELSAEAGFSPLLSGFPATTQELRYTPTAELPSGRLYWRVAAVDSSSGQGSFGSGSFVKSPSTAPKALTPVPGKEFVFPTEPILFSWESLPSASSYVVEVDDADDFVGATSYTTKNTSYVLTEPVTVGQSFYWRVRGVAGTVYSDWSTTSSFRSIWPETPQLKYPGDGASVTDLYLDWDPVVGAKTYQVQVSPNGDWANNVTVDVKTLSTRYTPPRPLNNGNYYWRVRALDAAKTANAGSWSSVRVFERVWTDKPSLLWPKNGGSTADVDTTDPTWQNATFRWTPVKRASFYRVQFATNESMTTDLGGCVTNRTTYSLGFQSEEDGIGMVTGGGCELKFTQGKTYYWRVGAIDSPVLNNGLDPWPTPELSGVVFGQQSAVQSFVFDAPFPAGTPRQLESSDYLTPAACDPVAGCNAVERGTPTFTWTAIPGVSRYNVEVALDRNFTNIYRKYSTYFNRLTPRDSWRDNQAGQAYYWRVTPDGLTTATSYSVFSKQTAGVRRTAPAGGATQANDFTFEWEDYLATNQALTPASQEAAQTYQIEVSTTSDFATVIDRQVVNTPFYTPQTLTYPDGPIYWRVQALDGSNNKLTLSSDANGSVTKQSPAPALTLPADAGEVKGVPYLQWVPLAYAASYDVQLDDDASFATPIKTVTTKMSAWTYPETLAAGNYYWRVRRNDADDRDGAWSTVRSFSLSAAAVSLTGPADGSSPAKESLLLQWQASQPSPYYRVELSSSPTFTNQASGFPQETVMSALAPKSLLAGGTYYWRVRSLNASKQVIGTSSAWQFSVSGTTTGGGGEAPRVSGLSPSSNAAVDSSFTVTFSKPVKGVDAKSFTVTASGSATAVAGTITTPTTTTAKFTPKQALIPGQTYSIAVTKAVTDESGVALTAYSKSVRTSTTVQQTSAAVKRAWPTWKTSAADGGSLKLSQRAKSTLTYTFTGTKVDLLGYTANTGGTASISLDGSSKGTVSFYSKKATAKATIWSSKTLSKGKHVLKVTVLGKKPKGSKGKWVYLDGFKVDGTKVKETASGVVDGFARVSKSKASGGSYDAMDFVKASKKTGSSLSFGFVGSQITWNATTSKTSGKAVVYIDNVKKATVDLYSKKTTYQKKVWTGEVSGGKQHTIKIVVLGVKRKAAKGYDVSFDMFALK